MKVVLDTNVVVSGLMTQGGHCDRILRLVGAEAIYMCVDERILAEYEDVLPRPMFDIPPEHVAQVFDVIRSGAEVVTATPLAVTLPHPSDLPFLEVACEAGAVLVTGNLRHFSAKARAGVTVVSPREFIELLSQSQ